MLEKYDEFKNRNKEINKKISGLKRQKLQLKLDKFNKMRQEAQKKITLSGPSYYR